MKKNRTPKLLQNAVSRFITQEMPMSTFGAMTTITGIYLNSKQSFAKIYISFLPIHNTKSETSFLEKIVQEKSKLKKYLAQELGHKLRAIPDLKFYIDTSAKEAIAMEQMLANLA